MSPESSLFANYETEIMDYAGHLSCLLTWAFRGRIADRTGKTHFCRLFLTLISPDFNEISKEEIDKAAALLNNRPRKGLNYRTPHEVLWGG
jgi:hypothetical protein